MRIRVNGAEYDSWDDVPEHERHLLEKVLPDADHNGVPDVLEGKVEPGHHTYTARFVATDRTKVTRVPQSGTRPGFRFQMTDTEVRAVPPDPDDLQSEPGSAGSTAQQAQRPILLNGVPVDAEGKPLKKRRRWGRG